LSNKINKFSPRPGTPVPVLDFTYTRERERERKKRKEVTHGYQTNSGIDKGKKGLRTPERSQSQKIKGKSIEDIRSETSNIAEKRKPSHALGRYRKYGVFERQMF
jgi:hypothetical protein